MVFASYSTAELRVHESVKKYELGPLGAEDQDSYRNCDSSNTS